MLIVSCCTFNDLFVCTNLLYIIDRMIMMNLGRAHEFGIVVTTLCLWMSIMTGMCTNHREWILSLLGIKWFGELLSGNYHRFHNIFRMRQEAFIDLREVLISHVLYGSFGITREVYQLLYTFLHRMNLWEQHVKNFSILMRP